MIWRQATVRFLRGSEADGEQATKAYELEIDRHIQGCEFITTRSLASVRDAELRRFAEAHLWRFAGIQLADGLFPAERYGSGFGQIGILEAFARYPHHPITPVVILKSLPWLVAAQREDGSWSQGEGSASPRGARRRRHDPGGGQGVEGGRRALDGWVLGVM